MKLTAVAVGMFACLVLSGCKASEAAAKTQDWADRICACKDLECIKAVQKEQEEWIQKNGSEFTGSEADVKRIEEATKTMTDCLAKAVTAGGG